MRCYPYLLPQSLKNNLFTQYLLFGNEPFLIEESKALIKQRVRALGEVEHIILSLEGSTSTLFTQIEQPALFAPYRLFEIVLPSKLSSCEQLLLEVLQKQPPDTYFLIQAGQLSRKNQQANWFIEIERKGIVVPHWPLSLAQFSKWLTERAKQRGLTLSPEILSQLLYFTEGNCLAGAQEIEKLCLNPTDKDPMLSLTQQSQFDVFDLCEAALSQQPERTVKILSCFKESNSIPLQLILWAFSQILRTMLQCALNHPNQENQWRHLLQRAGIRLSLHEACLKMLKEVPPAQFASLLARLSKIDRQLKSGELTSAWRNMLEICLHLAGMRIFPKAIVEPV